MRRALVLFVAALIVACGSGAPAAEGGPSAQSASVAADELTLDIPELL
jgi:hypothetical protein